TSAARHAAAQLAAGAPDAKSAVELAAFACADAFVKICADAIQMHGGIAFTWNHPAHLYLRRARADAQLFGAPAFHREFPGPAWSRPGPQWQSPPAPGSPAH
ncbi:MAG: hypothetical protein B7X58_14185, partial [Marinobacter sp. 34-60-7]